MGTTANFAEIFEKIRKLSSADEVEASFSFNDFALTRFANNVIHQNLAERNVALSVRTNFGGRTARATTNKLDDESLKQVVAAGSNTIRGGQEGN